MALLKINAVVGHQSWGAGRYDPRFNQDGKNFPVLIPPAYGLANVRHSTYTGDGDISYWNNYTTPLRALWQHAPYFHDGTAASLSAVVDHYAGALKLNLSAQQKQDLVEYLKSI